MLRDIYEKYMYEREKYMYISLFHLYVYERAIYVCRESQSLSSPWAISFPQGKNNNKGTAIFKIFNSMYQKWLKSYQHGNANWFCA